MASCGGDGGGGGGDGVAAESEGQIWEIVGGADRGGIIVREGAALTSAQSASRLATGARVLELDHQNERLHYRKISGAGPDEGWIAITLKDKVLARRLTAKELAAERASDASAPVEAALDEEVESDFPELAPPSNGAVLDEDAAERQRALSQQALDALDDGQVEVALERLTAAIVIGCPSALLYSRRAQVLLQSGRPRAAIIDCTAALEVNPDSGKAFKIRARARARLKHWAEAHADFQEGLRIDYDEATYEESVAVAEKMKGIQAVAAERRAKEDEADHQRRLSQARARHEAMIREHREAEERREAEAREKRFAETRLAGESYFREAKRQGFMFDFMGVKRGPCKCSKCDFYVWRPVRISG